MEQLFSAKEVCEIFRISQSTLNRRVAASEFPPPRKLYPNGDNRWTKSALDGVFSSMSVASAYKDSNYRKAGMRAA